MANNFKSVIDRHKWVQVAPLPTVHAAGGSLCCDLRNDASRMTAVYQLASATVLNRFNIVHKSSMFVQSPALAGTFGAGAGCIFVPSANIKGTIGAGCTTTSIVTSTSITSVGVNMLANRLAGQYGFRVRIIGNAGAGSSGLTEEKWIIGNTGGTTPTLLLDSALSFTPANGDAYEILSGSVYMLSASTLAANIFKSLEVAANTLTARTTTNLPATIGTDFAAVALDEQYVPYDRKPGEGFVVGAGTYSAAGLNCLVSTAVAAGTITGQAAAGDASVLANEYRNFQIRIVEDTTNKTAVGQRRIIASHTAGASPVYTLGSNWTVTPSSGAKFVIENPNLILLRSSNTAVVYTYNYGTATCNNGTNTIAADAWSATYFGNAGGAMATGAVALPSWGIVPDAAKNARHSFIYMFRGGNSSTLDVLDIAGGTTGSWSNAVVYDGATNFNTGTCGQYAPSAQEGRFGYVNIYTASGVNQIFRFDVKNRALSPITPTDWIQAGTAAQGGRLASYVAIDGSDKYTVLLLQSHLAANAMELIVMA